MNTIAIVAATMFAVATPALAQEAGAPGATGVAGPMSGANSGSGYAPNYYNNGYYGPRSGYYGHDFYNDENAGVVEGPAPYQNGPGMVEGRAAAPDYDYDYQYKNPSASGPGYPRAGGTPNSQW